MSEHPTASRETSLHAKSDRPPGGRGRRLWLNHDFGLLWAAHTLSVTGSEFSKLGLPLIGLLLLNASALEVGLLWAAQTLPYLLFALPVGVMVDRVSRRTTMVICDLLRAAALGAVAALAITDQLTLATLLGAAFLIGIGTVAFELAAVSLVPAIVDSTPEILKANVRLSLSEGIAFTLGPAIAGAVIRWFGAAAAVIVDAFSYLFSGLLLRGVREDRMSKVVSSEGFWPELTSGLVFVLRHSLIRPLVVTTALSNISFAIFAPMLLVFATRELDMTPDQIGLIFSVAAASYLAGTLMVEPLVVRLGAGRTIVWSLLLNSISIAVIFAEPGLRGIALVGVSWCAISLLVPLYNTVQMSLRQVVTPEHMMGRMNAAVRVVAHGSEPLGALLGGVLAVWLGLRATLAVSVLLAVLAAVPLMFSPVMGVRSLTELEKGEVTQS